MDVFLTILDVFLPVSVCKNASVWLFLAVILCMTVLLSEVHTLWQIYTSRCISAACKNAMYPLFCRKIYFSKVTHIIWLRSIFINWSCEVLPSLIIIFSRAIQLRVHPSYKRPILDLCRQSCRSFQQCYVQTSLF